MTGETMAERHYRSILEPDRDQQLEHMRQRVRELGDTESAERLDAMMVEFAGTEAAALGHNPVSATMSQLAGQVKAALADLGADPDRLATVYVGATLDEAVSAQMRPYSDGSGLVQVSDAILSLSTVYARFTGDVFVTMMSGGRLRAMWRILRGMSRGELGGDPAVLTTLLRYYNVNQRVHGLAAKLQQRVTDEAEGVAAYINLHAARFVVGHEIAHHVLRHSSQPSAFSPDEYLPACSADEQRELDADLLAYRAVVRAAERDFAKVPPIRGADPATFAMVGALTAMLTVHATEQALFIRKGCTHPPAPTRATLLLDQLDRAKRGFADLFMRTLLSATEAASVFDESATPFDWEWAVATPAISSSQPPEYLRQMWALDRLQCQPVPRLVQMLEGFGEDATPLIADGAYLAASGEIERALLAWAVPPETVARIADRTTTLTFHTLVAHLRSSLSTVDIQRDAVWGACVVAARLAAIGLAA